MVELKRVDLEQVEVDQQRRLASCLARPAGAELGLHAIEAAAPVPVIVPLAKHRPGVRFPLVVPELAVHVPDPVKGSGSFLAGTLIDVEPGRDRGVNIKVARVGTVTAMNLGRLRGRQRQNGVGLHGERLDLGARIVPGVLPLSGRVEGDVGLAKMVVVGVVVDVVLVERDRCPSRLAVATRAFIASSPPLSAAAGRCAGSALS